MADDGGVIDMSAENTNKKTTYFVIDGAEAMFMDDPSGKAYGPECSFVKALKAVYTFCVRLCVTEEALRHMVGVLVMNTKATETNPDVAMGAENMRHLFPLCFLDKEKVLELEDLINARDLKKAYDKLFGGHTRASYQKMASYSKLTISYSSTSKRFTSWVHFTNNTNPFKKNFANDDEYRKMLRNLHDIEGRKANSDDGKRRPLRGRCTVFVLGNEELSAKDLAMWRSVDADANKYEKDLESNLLRKTGAVRAFSVIPFSLGPGVEFNIGVYMLCSTKLKPTPIKVHKATGAPISSITLYSAKKEEGGEEEMEGIEEVEVKSGVKGDGLIGPGEVPRHALANVRNIGGETLMFKQFELEAAKRFPKGLRLIEFRPLADVDVWEHVRAPWVIRPHEQSHTGATSLYTHLFERMAARKMAAICEYTARANQRPRHVAIIPNEEHEPQEGVHRGFIVVELHDVDDKLDIEAAFDEKIAPPTANGTWAEPNTKAVKAAKQFCESIMEQDFTPIAYPNPHLQAFYAMIKREANVEAPDVDNGEWEEAMREEWDRIHAWFDSPSFPSKLAADAEEASTSFAHATGVFGWDPEAKPAPKRRGAGNGESSAAPKRGRGGAKGGSDETQDLESLAVSDKLSTLTLARLRELAADQGVEIKSSARKKDDVINCIKQYYRL